MNYEDLTNFFIQDSSIKMRMNEDLDPKNKDLTSEEYRNEYLNNTLSKYLQQFYSFYLKLLNKFGISRDTIEFLDKKFNDSYYEIFASDSKKDPQKVHFLFEKYVSNMDMNIVNKVHEQCKGHFEYRNIEPILRQCNSVNEYLHVAHSYIVNNENILKNMPVVNKLDSDSQSIHLYGETSVIGNQIFNFFLQHPEVDSSIVDIVSIPSANKTIVMARDLGHALTFDITKDDDGYVAKYFIPKITNVAMVNRLKGVTKVQEGRDEFKTTVGTLAEKDLKTFLDDFESVVSNVPTDADMPDFDFSLR